MTPLSYVSVSLASGSLPSANADAAATACSASRRVSLKMVELCTPSWISLTEAISASWPVMIGMGWAPSVVVGP